MADQYYDDEDYEEEEGDEEYERPAWLTDMPYWAISAVVHLILVMLLVAFVVEEAKAPSDEIPITVRQKPKPPEYDPTLKRDVKKTPKILHRKQIKDPIIQRKLDEVTTEIPKGTNLNNLSNDVGHA